MSALAAVWVLVVLVNLTANEWHGTEFDALPVSECAVGREVEHRVRLKGNVLLVVPNYPIPDADKNCDAYNFGAIFKAVDSSLKLILSDWPAVPYHLRALRKECVANLGGHCPQHSCKLSYSGLERAILVAETFRDVIQFNCGAYCWGCSNILNLNFNHNINEVGFKACRPNKPYTSNCDPCSLVSDHGLACYIGGRFSSRDRLFIGIQGLGNVDDTKSSDPHSESRENHHPKSPIGHIPLGLKVLLFAPFFAGGTWIGWRGLQYGARASSHSGTVGGALFLLLGSGVATGAFILAFVL